MADPIMNITAIKLFEDYLLELRAALDQSYGMLNEATSLLKRAIWQEDPDKKLTRKEIEDAVLRIAAFLPELNRIRLMKAAGEEEHG